MYHISSLHFGLFRCRDALGPCTVGVAYLTSGEEILISASALTALHLLGPRQRGTAPVRTSHRNYSPWRWPFGN